MDDIDAAEILKTRWLDCKDSMPSLRIVSATCPFCGKGDRIGLLPDAREMGLISDENYSAAWEMLSGPTRSVGICGFCCNVVLISGNGVLMPGME